MPHATYRCIACGHEEDVSWSISFGPPEKVVHGTDDDEWHEMERVWDTAPHIHAIPVEIKGKMGVYNLKSYDHLENECWPESVAEREKSSKREYKVQTKVHPSFAPRRPIRREEC